MIKGLIHVCCLLFMTNLVGAHRDLNMHVAQARFNKALEIFNRQDTYQKTFPTGFDTHDQERWERLIWQEVPTRGLFLGFLALSYLHRPAFQKLYFAPTVAAGALWGSMLYRRFIWEESYKKRALAVQVARILHKDPHSPDPDKEVKASILVELNGDEQAQAKQASLKGIGRNLLLMMGCASLPIAGMYGYLHATS